MVVQAGNNGNGTAGVTPANPTNPTPTPTPTLPAPTSTHWRADEIGLFDPHLDKSHGDSEIATVSKDVYYRSVMLFIERVRDMATIKGAQLVQINLNTCLRGSALAWYTSELSNLERIGLRNDENGVEEWCQALKNRFKESAAVSLASLTSTKYTMADARNHREPAAYVQTILRHAKSANIESVENQLTFTYQNITTDL